MTTCYDYLSIKLFRFGLFGQKTGVGSKET